MKPKLSPLLLLLLTGCGGSNSPITRAALPPAIYRGTFAIGGLTGTCTATVGANVVLSELGETRVLPLKDIVSQSAGSIVVKGDGIEFWGTVE